jgi:alpha-tubulin suppressor-like RCC1 family protein
MNEFIENTEMRPPNTDPDRETRYNWECPEILEHWETNTMAENCYKEYFFKYGERSESNNNSNSHRKSSMTLTQNNKKSTERQGPKYRVMLIHRAVYPNKILKICCGFDFTIFLTDEGSVWAWGNGAAGCLGQLSSKSELEPKRIDHGFFECAKDPKKNNRVEDIEVGHSHCLAVNKSRMLFSWGSGQNGVLGLGDRNSRQTPNFIDGIPGGIKSISAGNNHSACITENSLVYTWGLGASGRLGHGTDETLLTPCKVDQIESESIVSISCGYDYTLFTNITGFVFACGDSSCKKLALNPQFGLNCIYTPNVIAQKNEFYNMVDICAGFDHSLALKESGMLFAWGSTEKGKLGVGKIYINEVSLPQAIQVKNKNTPDKLVFFKDNLDSNKIDLQKNTKLSAVISRSYDHNTNFGAKLMTADKFLGFVIENIEYFGLSWTDGDRLECETIVLYRFSSITRDNVIREMIHLVEARLERGETSNADEKKAKRFIQSYGIRMNRSKDILPVKKQNISNINYTPATQSNKRANHLIVDCLECTDGNTFFRSSDGTLLCCGDVMMDGSVLETVGGMQVNDTTYNVRPVKEMTEKIKFIACGGNHVIAIDSYNRTWTWGDNGHYQCGISQEGRVDVPTLIPELEALTIVSASASRATSFFVSDMGILYGCGTSECGNLGANNRESNYVIYKAESIHCPPIIHIAAGDTHTVAITK